MSKDGAFSGKEWEGQECLQRESGRKSGSKDGTFFRGRFFGICIKDTKGNV